MAADQLIALAGALTAYRPSARGHGVFLVAAVIALLLARVSRAKHWRRRRAWYRGVYLRSPHWRRRRARAVALAGGRCTRCGRPSRRLEVHHRTYARLGRERDRDLEALCPLCHDRRHLHG